MSNDPNQTQPVERLIKLKRWEEPPPGHLDTLSSRIIAQIEADKVLSKETFWSRLVGFLEFKPVLACSYSAAAMGLLVLGLGMKNEVQGPKYIQNQPANDFKLTGMKALVPEPEVKAASFSLPSTAGKWHNSGSVWTSTQGTNSSSTHPVVHSTISSMPVPLGAQFLRTDRPIETPSESRRTTRAASYQP